MHHNLFFHQSVPLIYIYMISIVHRWPICNAPPRIMGHPLLREWLVDIMDIVYLLGLPFQFCTDFLFFLIMYQSNMSRICWYQSMNASMDYVGNLPINVFFNLYSSISKCFLCTFWSTMRSVKPSSHQNTLKTLKVVKTY